MTSPSPLRALLDRTVRTFPWYGELLAERGIARTSVRTLEELPLITAGLLERHYYGQERPYRTEGEDTDAEQEPGTTAYRTSGTSSNRRKTIYYSAGDERHYVDIKARLFGRLLESSGVRTALSDMGTGHAAGTALEIFARLGIRADSIPFELPIERHLERLRTLRPEALYTMPSILDRLLAATREDPAGYGIRRVLLVGEIASPAWLRGVEARLGLAEGDVVDTYGSIEIGTIAYYSREHGRYLFAEGIVPEGLSAEELGNEFDSLREGESVLALTSLVRELFPAVRYVTYDVVRDLRPILVDGTWKPSFEAIVRRVGPDLKHGEKISVYDIENVVYRHLPDANVRIRVIGNRLAVHVGSPNAGPALFERIGNELAERIPEIGQMIRGGLLEAIRVLPLENGLADAGPMKRKKVFYD